MAVMVYSDAWGKLIHEKTRSRKSRDTVPLKVVYNEKGGGSARLRWLSNGLGP